MLNFMFYDNCKLELKHKKTWCQIYESEHQGTLSFCVIPKLAEKSYKASKVSCTVDKRRQSMTMTNFQQLLFFRSKIYEILNK